MCSSDVHTQGDCGHLTFGRRCVSANAVLLHCIDVDAISPTRRVPSGSVYIRSPGDNEHNQCACGYLMPGR